MSGRVNENREMDYPKLRPIEAIPATNGMICLRDPQRFSEKLLFLPYNAFFIVSLFDGEHSILDIQTAYIRKYGDLLFSDKIRDLAEQLDKVFFLESSRFQEAKQRIIEEFKSSPLRLASHAGTAYEKDKDVLMNRLEEQFKAREGSGFPDARSPEPRLRGLIAPHIDISRGGGCFAWGYAELFRECGATTFVILGISHVQTRRRFVLTTKDFDTPLGVMPTDREFIGSLSKRCRTDFLEDEFVHRGEHSVEFQVLFLRYLFRKSPEARIVPILCSSLGEDWEAAPTENAEVQEFIISLAQVLEERGNQACCIAGVDLSHLGQRFGQNLTLTPQLLAWAEQEDRRMIQRILDRDAEGFYRFIQEEKDSRNVCGVPAIYLLLRLLNAQSARLLKYDQSVDTSTQSVVTFMSAAFYE